LDAGGLKTYRTEWGQRWRCLSKQALTMHDGEGEPLRKKPFNPDLLPLRK